MLSTNFSTLFCAVIPYFQTARRFELIKIVQGASERAVSPTHLFLKMRRRTSSASERARGQLVDSFGCKTGRLDSSPPPNWPWQVHCRLQLQKKNISFGKEIHSNIGKQILRNIGKQIQRGLQPKTVKTGSQWQTSLLDRNDNARIWSVLPGVGFLFFLMWFNSSINSKLNCDQFDLAN